MSAFAVRVNIDAWEAVGIVSQTLFVDTLLYVITITDPDRSIAFVTRVNPVCGIEVDPVAVAAEKDLLSLR